MPDPKQLAVGDRVVFSSIPAEWQSANYQVLPECRELMEILVARRGSSRVAWIDEYGQPWIEVRVREKDGSLALHTWSIMETTGWRPVRKRRA